MGPTADSTSSTEGAARAAAVRAVVLGRVVGAHGLRGQLRVSVLGDDAANLMRVPAVWLSPTEEEPGAGRFEVASVAPGRRGEVRMTLSGVRDRDAADALRGLLVLGCVADLERLPPGEYYAYELVGCSVEDTAGRQIGSVARIWETGAQDLLVVSTPEGREHLVPAATPILQDVDLVARRLVIDPPPGLLDAPTPR